jgi:hypothetical protein
MGDQPRWLTRDFWCERGIGVLSVEGERVAALGPAEREVLERYGLPAEIAGMFHPHENGRTLDEVQVPRRGLAHVLKQNELAHVLGQNEVFVTARACAEPRPVRAGTRGRGWPAQAFGRPVLIWSMRSASWVRSMVR